MAVLRINHRMVAQSPTAGALDYSPGWKSRTETGLAAAAPAFFLHSQPASFGLGEKLDGDAQPANPRPKVLPF